MIFQKDIADQFAKLQDNVAPFSGKIAKKIIEDAYGSKINDVFLEFDEIPLASASVAQVHSATLKDGRDFIIKVIRPGIESTIRKDLDLLHLLAKKAERYNKNAESLKFTDEVVLVLDRNTDRTDIIARKFTKKIFKGTWICEAERRNYGSDWR